MGFLFFHLFRSGIEQNSLKFPGKVNSEKNRDWFFGNIFVAILSLQKLYVQSCEAISNKKKEIRRLHSSGIKRAWSLEPCYIFYCYFFKPDPLLMFWFCQKQHSWFKELVWKPNLTRLVGSVTSTWSEARFINTVIFSRHLGFFFSIVW